jgi:thiamine biosynthesis protein ThiC
MDTKIDGTHAHVNFKKTAKKGVDEKKPPKAHKSSASSFNIDELFQSMKTAKVHHVLQKDKEVKKALKEAKIAAKRAEIMKEVERDGLATNRMKSPDSPTPLRFDDSINMPIYSEESLGMHNPKAGTTKECPFDCNCCH